ncbi:serine/threonine-protein kinase Nek8 isoform X1 [Dryobates pubescens]|uniref:serine/threonine-protein kinase Nek8 isoform X1 n=1 Tax=Dryobates pubescens TaxID=118200 RepID=UPI0023B9CFFD|nr:serine/threonine-protein kinase Nek8 isoform X1 [Dryobates pubescens]
MGNEGGVSRPFGRGKALGLGGAPKGMAPRGGRPPAALPWQQGTRALSPCIVHLCLRKADQKLVILKQIPVEQMSKDERLAAQNECQVLKLLSHPNVIEYYENFLEDKALMIAMEYAPGGTLAEFIHKRCNSLLDEDTILHFFVQIVLALHHVHTKQILHRDLKTQNILLDKHRMIVKIGDFGISKILSSKSKAYTVVGTPCYISPELCEGKPYNQKSDIWALGCVLYELASLKRAFEAANLPALVLKIMSGTFAPISDRYSPDLRQLILSMLNLDPSKRPQLNEIMAQAICIRPLLNLYTDVGSVKMRRPEKPMAPVPAVTHSRTGGRVSSARPRGVRGGSARTGIPPPLSSIYTWGSGITTPLRLPMLNTEVMQVSAGRTQKAGVTKSGRLIMWEAPPMGAAGGPSLPGATEQLQPQFVSRFLEGQSGVTIKHVSCGDLFTACLTDRGIIMTFGSGSNGCLGHGNFTDVSQVCREGGAPPSERMDCAFSTIPRSWRPCWAMRWCRWPVVRLTSWQFPTNGKCLPGAGGITVGLGWVLWSATTPPSRSQSHWSTKLRGSSVALIPPWSSL